MPEPSDDIFEFDPTDIICLKIISIQSKSRKLPNGYVTIQSF